MINAVKQPWRIGKSKAIFRPIDHTSNENKVNDYHNSELLRFTTAGSVDDGKSTLIGRLLYDSKSIFQDQYDAIKQASELVAKI